MSEIRDMEVPELNALINARLKAIEKRNKAEEAAKRMEKDLKKMTK